MASTNFVDFSTPIVAAWLNDINSFFYALFGGATTPAQALAAIQGMSSVNPTFTGNLTSTSVGARIRGTLDGALATNRLMFQTTTLNAGTVVGAIPNGTGNFANYVVFSSTDPDNCAYSGFYTNPGTTVFFSDKTGSGVAVPLALAVNGGTRLLIDTSGRVALGGIAPFAWDMASGNGASLDIRALGLWGLNSTNSLILGNGYWDGSAFRAKVAGPITYMQMVSGAFLLGNTPSVAAGAVGTATERLSIQPNGDMYYASTGGFSVFTLGATSATTSVRMKVSYAGGGSQFGIETRTTIDGSTCMIFKNPSDGVSGTITQSALTCQFNTSSDYRLKNVVGSVGDSGDKLDALKPIIGTWKENGNEFRGFLAHEFAEVFPGSVHGEKDGVDDKGEPIIQQMDASTPEVMATIIAELQSLRQRVALLEA